MRTIIADVPGLAVALVVAGWAGTLAMAQSIQGTVFDPDGGLVPKASVMLMQDYTKLKEIAADENGRFIFGDLVPGRYQVQIKQPMFSLFQQTVEVRGTEQTVVYAVLPLGRMSDSMRINARLAPTVQRNQVIVQKGIRTGGKAEAAKILQFPLPEFPPGPDARGVEGDVVLYATIKPDGSVADLVVISSPDPEFDAASAASVKNWRYRPMRLNGHPVESQVMIVLQFRLR